uniref:G_PROTEIN_RECEP_F1_2 domain-containing protein n=1 Tax=Caenorhabditis tropicalis TaxID=1561998 RepID=A0A1I7UAU9_9PELO
MSIPNETDFNFRDSYNVVAGVSMALVSMIGIPSNAIIVYVYFKNSSEKTSFNTLNVTRATASLYILILLYLMVFIPTAFVGFMPYLSVPTVTIIISLGMALYAVNENQTLLTALNRFCALYFPFYYSRLCGMKLTVLLLFILWTYRLGKVIIPILLIDLSENDCWNYFSPYYLTWTITNASTCMAHDDSILVALEIFALTTVINIATFSKVLYFYRNKSRSDAVSRRNEKRNIILFFQTVLQDFLYVIDFTFTFYFSSLINHRLWTFLSGSLIWQLIHAIDGVIMIIFNDKITFLKRCFSKGPVLSEPQSTPHSEMKRHSISAALATIN